MLPVVPSPKSHAHEAGAPLDVSVNCTAIGAGPLVGVAVKDDTGAAIGAVVDRSACQ